MSKIHRMVDKEVLSVQELRELTNMDEVVEVRSVEPDKKYPKYLKYHIYLQNGELYFIYVK